VARPLRKNLDDPDEIVSLPLLDASVVEVGGLTVARIVHRPGWRWAEHVRPDVGTEWCEARHMGLALSGLLHVTLRDGSEYDVTAGDVFEILPGHDGFVVGDEPFVELEWQGFRTFAGGRARGVLTTMLFTDLVESTSTAARIGDAAWRDVLAGHYEDIRAELDRSGGREVKTTGDGVLAVFDAPPLAIRSAAAIRDAAGRRDLHIRAGVHVGEVQIVGDNVEGLAVHEAARVMETAGRDEILLSETTRLLAVDVPVEDRGTHRLKGIPGERRLFAVRA
jgi:class 3 adenylate cyclase